MRKTLLIALVVAVLAGGFATVASTQGMTGEAAAGEDPLTRYDSPSTRQLAAEYAQNQARAEEIEARMEELEEDFDFGPERDRLREELYSMPDPTEAANALGNARLSDIESAPLPDGGEAKAAELRKKAASLGALQSWATTAPINIDSRLYGVLSDGEAAGLARTYRAEAGALEVAEGAEEAAREEAEGAEPEAVPERESKESGEEEAAGEPETAPGNLAPAEQTGTGFEGVNFVPVLVLAALGVAASVYLTARRYEGLGGLRERFSGLPNAPKPKTAPKLRQRVPREAPGGAQGVTEPREAPRGSEPRAEPREAAEGRERPATRPSTATETGSPDAEHLAAWFAREAPEKKEAPQPEEKKESRRSERSERRRRRRGDAPEETRGGTPEETPEAAKGAAREAPKDVNRMVAEEVARMRESGELGPDDEVVVTVVDGKLVVRKKE